MDSVMALRKNRGGPRTPFGPKHLPNRSHSLTRFGKEILRSAAKRTGTSESNVVELLVRKFGGTVEADDIPDPGVSS